jgi:hypothetical protein
MKSDHSESWSAPHMHRMQENGSKPVGSRSLRSPPLGVMSLRRGLPSEHEVKCGPCPSTGGRFDILYNFSELLVAKNISFVWLGWWWLHVSKAQAFFRYTSTQPARYETSRFVSLCAMRSSGWSVVNKKRSATWLLKEDQTKTEKTPLLFKMLDRQAGKP